MHVRHAVRHGHGKTDKTVEVEVKRLERIAEYYEFPFAAFFGGEFTTKTRNEALQQKADAFDKIRELLSDILNEDFRIEASLKRRQERLKRIRMMEHG